MELYEAYRNLNRKGLWFSFKSCNTGLVVKRVDLAAGDVACLRNVTFKVSKAGRQRVLREKRKNVHATIKGEPVFPGEYIKGQSWRVKYDPYKNDTFIGVAANGMTIKLKTARWVTFDKDGVFAWI